MRTLILASAALAGVAVATPAAAQQVWANGRWVVMPNGGGQVQPHRPDRWGGMIDGRWQGGARAPGGWGAYRRPARGWTLPRYWTARDFRIPDYLTWGLPAPPRGYFWVRYYDDAVLTDDSGTVWDSRGDIAWSGGVAAGAYATSESHSNVTVQGAGYGAPYRGDIRPVDPDAYYEDGRYEGGGYREDGYYDDEYARGGVEPPVAPYGPPPAVRPHYAPQPECYCAPGQSGAGYGYSQGSYGYAQGGYGYGYVIVPSTTVVVQTGGSVTTTTTVVEEYYEDEGVRYAPAPSKNVKRKRVYRSH